MTTGKAATTHEGGHFHAVRFYNDSDSLARLVSEFVSDGFSAGLPAIVIATPEHRELITKHLRAKLFSVDLLQTSGDLFLVDADDVLSQFMVNGMPDPVRFRNAVIPLIEKACEGRPGCVVRAYGEMVDVLWKAGQTVAAVRLETLWNQLAQSHAFSLLCGYAMGSFYKDAAQEEIRSHHTHTVSASGEATTVQ